MPQSSLMGWLSKPVPAKPAFAPTLDEQPASPLPPQASADQANTESKQERREFNPDRKGHVKAPGLPQNAELRECRKEDIKSFKRLNSLLLPIPYGDSFYREILADEVTRNITLMALWHDQVTSDGEQGTLVGAIRCRLLSNFPGAAVSAPRKEGPMLYLSTLVLLSPYRGHGIAAKMLDVMVRRAVNDYGVGSVGAHVWEANEEGLAWYRKRGFKEIGKEEGYYRRLKPQGALVMLKEIGVRDLLPD